MLLSEPRLPEQKERPYTKSLSNVCYSYLARILGFSGLPIYSFIPILLWQILA